MFHNHSKKSALTLLRIDFNFDILLPIMNQNPLCKMKWHWDLRFSPRRRF